MHPQPSARSGWSRAVPILAVLFAAAMGASSGLYIKGLAFSSLAMTSLRMTVPFILALPSAARHHLLLGAPGMRRRLIFASALNAARLFLYVLAYKLTTMGNAVVLLYLWPVFALIIDSVRIRKPLSLSRVVILLLSLGGVVIMNLSQSFSLAGPDLLGSVCMIVSALIFGGTNVIFKQVLTRISEIDTLYFQNGIGALVFLPFLIAEAPHAPLSHLGIGIFYGLAVGFIGFGLFFVGMKRLSLFQYSALSYSEVPFAMLLGIAFKGETMSATQGLGMALIVVGSFLAQRSRTNST